MISVGTTPQRLERKLKTFALSSRLAEELVFLPSPCQTNDWLSLPPFEFIKGRFWTTESFLRVPGRAALVALFPLSFRRLSNPQTGGEHLLMY